MGQFEAGADVEAVMILMMVMEGDKTGVANRTQDKL